MSEVAPQEPVIDTPAEETPIEDTPPAEEPNEFLALIEEDVASVEESATPEEPAIEPEPEGTPTPEIEEPSAESKPEAKVEPEELDPPADPPSEPEPIDMAAVQEQFAQQYAMSEDDIAAFEANPGTAIPQMLAKVQIQAMKQTMAAFQQMLPGLLQQHQTRSEAATKIGTTFKESYSGLSDMSDAEKGQLVSVAKMTKEMFPTLSPTELLHKSVKAFAEMTGKSLGTKEEEEVTPPAAQLVPHQPAMGSSTVLPNSDKKSEWEELLDD